MGQHADAISCMNYSHDQSQFRSIPFFLRKSISMSCLPPDTLVTGSWDRTIRFWDSRAPNHQTSSHDLPERVYNMDLVNHILVVAMASRLFHIYDIRKMDAVAQTRESSLKFMTRALACMSDGLGMPCPIYLVNDD